MANLTNDSLLGDPPPYVPPPPPPPRALLLPQQMELRRLELALGMWRRWCLAQASLETEIERDRHDALLYARALTLPTTGQLQRRWATAAPAAGWAQGVGAGSLLPRASRMPPVVLGRVLRCHSASGSTMGAGLWRLRRSVPSDTDDVRRAPHCTYLCN